MQIENGYGSGGHRARVDEDGRIDVSSKQASKFFYASRDHGGALKWTATADWGADKNALWLRNDSTTAHLHIEKAYVAASTSAQFEVWTHNGSTSGGTAVVGTVLNRTMAPGWAYTCTHTNTNVDAGSGMTLVGTSYSLAGGTTFIDFEGALILGYHDEVAINLITDVGSASVNLEGWFHLKL